MAESVPHPLPGGEVRASFRSILPDRTAKLCRLKLYILAVKSKIGQDLKPRRHFPLEPPLLARLIRNEMKNHTNTTVRSVDAKQRLPGLVAVYSRFHGPTARKKIEAKQSVVLLQIISATCRKKTCCCG